LRPAEERLWSEQVRRPTTVFGLAVPREILNARIEARARAMFDAGVEDEVRAALRVAVSATAVRALGLREIAELPRDRALEAVVLRTRRYAAYQRKWMRRTRHGLRRESSRGRPRRPGRDREHRTAARDERALSGPDERAGRARRRPGRGDGAGVGARGGGDAGVRNERGRGRRSDARRRRGDRALPGRRPTCPPRRR